MKWKPGDVLIEKENSNGGPLRAVIVVEPPEMFTEPRFDGMFKDRVWGQYLERDWWGGPWHGHEDKFELHPDPDSVWPLWAAFCARELTR